MPSHNLLIYSPYNLSQPIAKSKCFSKMFFAPEAFFCNGSSGFLVVSRQLSDGCPMFSGAEPHSGFSLAPQRVNHSRDFRWPRSVIIFYHWPADFSRLVIIINFKVSRSISNPKIVIIFYHGPADLPIAVIIGPGFPGAVPVPRGPGVLGVAARCPVAPGLPARQAIPAVSQQFGNRSRRAIPAAGFCPGCR